MNDILLVEFLKGTGTDARGRTHAEVLAMSDEELENEHDYIQWLFPLSEPSRAWPRSPYLEDKAMIGALRKDEEVQENLVNALVRMERFYRDTDHWLRKNDHNHLRITRILKSVMLLGKPEDAREFYEFIIRRVESAQPVTKESLDLWYKSLNP